MRVGSLDVTILVDGEGSFATIGDAFPALSSGEEWLLPVNAVLVRGAGPTVLIDTGLGPEPRAFMPDAGARLLAELARAGVSPAEVDLVVHTHPRKQVLGQLADRGTDVIVGHFHGPGRFSRQGEGFSWSSLAEEGEPAVE